MVKKKKGPLTAKEQERKRLLSLGRWMPRSAVHKSRKKYDRKNSKKELRQEADS